MLYTYIHKAHLLQDYICIDLAVGVNVAQSQV